MWKQIVLSLLIFHSCGNYLYMQDCFIFIFISFAYPIAFFRPLLHFNKKCKSKPALSWIIKIRRWYYYHFAYHRFNYLYIMNVCSGCHRACWIPKGCKWTSVIWKIWYLYENVKRNHQWMLTVYPKKYAHGFCVAVLCCGHTLTDFPYPSGLLHWHCGNLTIAPVPAKQLWWICINTSYEFIMNDCITTTKQSTTKPCAYFLGYTVEVHLCGKLYADLKLSRSEIRRNGLDHLLTQDIDNSYQIEVMHEPAWSASGRQNTLGGVSSVGQPRVPSVGSSLTATWYGYSISETPHTCFYSARFSDFSRK